MEQELYGIITEARSLLKAIPQSTANEKTLADYRAKATRMRSLAKDPNDFAELVAIAQQTKKASTWYARRAPLMIMARGGLDHYLTEQDKIQRQLKAAGIPATHEAWKKWHAAVKQVDVWRNRLRLVHDARLPIEGRSLRKGKRVDMKNLPVDWRQQLIKRMPTYYPATLVAAVTGCRPAELVNGVKLSIENGELVAVIEGAKNTKTTGQPWRNLYWPINTDSDLVRSLCEIVESSGGAIVVKIDSAKRFHGAVRSAGKREWPKRKSDVTPYCFRHQAAADLKAEGSLSSGEISAALGHLSDVTKSTYGHANMGRSGGVAPARVTAARAVKMKEPSENTRLKTANIKGTAIPLPKHRQGL
jgi:integrase